MNSTLYRVKIFHRRTKPKTHRFIYDAFTFCLDLTEISRLKEKFWLFRWGFYRFETSDFLSSGPAPVFEKLKSLVAQSGISIEGGRAVLLANLRTAGYLFNPVSFYFCYDIMGDPVCAVAEVNNTFGESKTYVLPAERGGSFVGQFAQNFYISPFVSVDATLALRLAPPSEKLNQIIWAFEGAAPVLFSSLTGEKMPLTNWNLIKLTFRFPLVTVFTILRIHWNAAILYFKGVPHFKKTEKAELQTNHYRKRNERRSDSTDAQI